MIQYGGHHARMPPPESPAKSSVLVQASGVADGVSVALRAAPHHCPSEDVPVVDALMAADASMVEALRTENERLRTLVDALEAELAKSATILNKVDGAPAGKTTTVHEVTTSREVELARYVDGFFPWPDDRRIHGVPPFTPPVWHRCVDGMVSVVKTRVSTGRMLGSNQRRLWASHCVLTSSGRCV